MYIVYVRMYVYISRTPAGSGSVAQPWLKKRPTNLICVCVYMCIYHIYLFLLIIRNSCDDCSLELYPGYISEDPR